MNRADFWNGILAGHAAAQAAVAPKANCFGIPDTYLGFRISQACDDRFYATPEGEDFDYDDLSAETWDDLRDRILGTIESNASGTLRWESTKALVEAERAKGRAR